MIIRNIKDAMFRLFQYFLNAVKLGVRKKNLSCIVFVHANYLSFQIANIELPANSDDNVLSGFIGRSRIDTASTKLKFSSEDYFFRYSRIPLIRPPSGPESSGHN